MSEKHTPTIQLRRASGDAARLFGMYGAVYTGGYLWPTGKTGTCNPVVAEIVNRKQGEFISLAVNAHDDLVAALRAAREWILHWSDDRLSGLPPTAESLSDALVVIDAALSRADGGV